jgi:hypothetical protein
MDEILDGLAGKRRNNASASVEKRVQVDDEALEENPTGSGRPQAVVPV